MIIEFGKYEVEIFDDEGYSLQSTDNLRKYTWEYHKAKRVEERFQPTSKHAIIVKEQGREISSAIICESAGATTRRFQSPDWNPVNK